MKEEDGGEGEGGDGDGEGEGARGEGEGCEGEGGDGEGSEGYVFLPPAPVIPVPGADSTPLFCPSLVKAVTLII